MEDLKRRLENFYRENPWTGLSVSFVAGMGLGAFGLVPVLSRFAFRGARLAAEASAVNTLFALVSAIQQKGPEKSSS